MMRLRVGYFWLSIFKYYVNVVKKCHLYQVFACNMHSHQASLHPIVTTGPFTKWGLDFMDCNPASAGGHHHIIVVVDYFTKWEKTIPIVKSDGVTASHFVFNQIITWFGIPKELVTDHCSRDNFRGELYPSGLFFHVFLPKTIRHFAFFGALFRPILMG